MKGQADFPSMALSPWRLGIALCIVSFVAAVAAQALVEQPWTWGWEEEGPREVVTPLARNLTASMADGEVVQFHFAPAGPGRLHLEARSGSGRFDACIRHGEGWTARPMAFEGDVCERQALALSLQHPVASGNSYYVGFKCRAAQGCTLSYTATLRTTVPG